MSAKGSYDDGKWTAMTMGHLLSLLVDAGQDPAVIMRVIEDTPVSDTKFVRKIEIIMIPNGSIIDILVENNVDRIHKTLLALLENGVIS